MKNIFDRLSYQKKQLLWRIGAVIAGLLICFLLGTLSDDDDNDRVGTLQLDEFQRHSYVSLNDNEFPGHTEFNSLPALLLSFNSNRIDTIYLCRSTGIYLCNNNPGFRLVEDPRTRCFFKFAVPAAKKPLLERLNAAIKELQASGELQNLAQYIGQTPPKTAIFDPWESSETIRIGITSDLPPWDATTANGLPCGHNRRILELLSDKLHARIVAVPLKLAERHRALTQGDIDAVFLLVSFNDQFEDPGSPVLASVNYHEENAAWIYKRSTRTKVRIRH